MSKKNINILVAVVAFILSLSAIIWGISNKNAAKNEVPPPPTQPEEVQMNPNAEIIDAIKKSAPLKYTVVKNARVIKLLSDDKNGPLHQRWIMEIDNGITITVFHNVNIAERVPLAEGTFVTVAGELEYGDKWKDPIMHWTHEDPKKQRKAGYVIFNGTTYGPATGP